MGYMSLADLITIIIIGAISGWIASIIMKSKGSIIKYIVLGILGGFVGGYLFGLLDISVALSIGKFDIGIILVSAVGACIVIFLVDKLLK